MAAVKGIQEGAGAAGDSAQFYDTRAHHPVIAQGKSDSHEQGDEAPRLLVHTEGCAAHGEDAGKNGDQQMVLSLHAAQNGAHQGVDRAALHQYTHIAAGEQEKEAGAGGAHEALINAHQQRPRPYRITGDAGIASGNDQLTAYLFIQHPLELAGGQDPSQNRAQQDDGKNDDVGVWYLPFSFRFHNADLLGFN